MSSFSLNYGEETLHVAGDFPQPGDYLPSFMLVDENNHDIALEHYGTRPKAIITLLSLDSADAGLELLRETLHHLEHWPQVYPIAVCVDSPFTLARVRHEHGLPHMALLSTLRGRDFHKRFGVLIDSYPLAGYTAPALIVADVNEVVRYSQRLDDCSQEFDYVALRQALNQTFPPPGEEEEAKPEAE